MWGITLILLALVSHADEQSFATVLTDCGRVVEYSVSGKKLTEKDLTRLRKIVSSLYDGGSMMFTYPGAPKPSVSPATRNRFLRENSSFFKDVPAAELDKKIYEYLESSPSSNVHSGPSRQELEGIISDKVWSQRLGKELVALIKKRISGKKGQGERVDQILEERFGLKRVQSVPEGEGGCDHSGHLFGAYYDLD